MGAGNTQQAVIELLPQLSGPINHAGLAKPSMLLSYWLHPMGPSGTGVTSLVYTGCPAYCRSKWAALGHSAPWRPCWSHDPLMCCAVCLAAGEAPGRGAWPASRRGGQQPALCQPLLPQRQQHAWRGHHVCSGQGSGRWGAAGLADGLGCRQLLLCVMQLVLGLRSGHASALATAAQHCLHPPHPPHPPRPAAVWQSQADLRLKPMSRPAMLAVFMHHVSMTFYLPWLPACC